jgi:hypothetical protein
MPSIFSYCIVGIFLTIALSGRKALSHIAPSSTIRVTSLRRVRQLLHPPHMTLARQLQSRAVPNLRLARAFALTNTFVSSDTTVHAQFASSALELLSAATPRGSWYPFTNASSTVLEETLSHARNTRIPFDLFMQHFVLKIILHTLFQVPATDLDDRGIALIAGGINILWKLSKTNEELPPTLLEDMNAYLRAWVPDVANPLDLVIPTFETLWRVVGITVALAYRDPYAASALRTFLECPTRDQFNRFPSDAPSVAAIVAEVMRLHPPTKSISRTHAASPGFLRRWLSVIILSPTVPTTYVADIRAVQRDREIWGPDADMFKPMRHHRDRLTNEQSQALLGFGLGKLQCVASKWAPLAVGILAAAVVDKVGNGLEIVEGRGVGGREGWDGWAIVVLPV